MTNTAYLKTFRLFTFISLLFIFLPSFYLPGTDSVPMYDIIIGISFFAFVVCFPKRFYRIIRIILKYKHFKILMCLVFWVIFAGILMVTLGKYYLFHFLYATFLLFIYNNIFWYIYPSLIFPQIFSLKYLIKFLYLGIYIVCIYGLLVYFCHCLGIGLLEFVQNIINNRREEHDTSRVMGVFLEPSGMGGFICMNLPLVYTLTLSKFKIFKNSNLNFFIKKTYIPIIIITIIFTQSPIFLIFFFIINLVYFHKNIINAIRRYFIYFLVSVFILIFSTDVFIKNIDISDTFLNRITRVIENMSDMESFIKADPSFASRIISYTTRVLICLKHPITGVGCKNAEFHSKEILSNELKNITLTGELNGRINESYYRGGYVQINGSILFILLSDTGFVGTFLFFYFLILSIKIIRKLIKESPPGIYTDFLKGMQQTYITLICLSVYNINLSTIYIWFLFGLTNVFIIYSKQQYKKIERIQHGQIL